jgi:hypothetical protein
MNSTILKLAKRLGKFCVEDILPIIEIDKVELQKILSELESEGSIQQRSDGTYFYQEEVKNETSKPPLFFEFHTKQEIELIIKCFCSDIEVAKAVNIVELKQSCLSKFYRYFREQIYTQQLIELQSYFKQCPKRPQEREYLGKIYYLYLYEHKLFVSGKAFKTVNMVKHTDEERLEVKNIFLRVNRKVLNRSYKHFYHQHLAEEIWRADKSFAELQNAISII